MRGTVDASATVPATILLPSALCFTGVVRDVADNSVSGARVTATRDPGASDAAAPSPAVALPSPWQVDAPTTAQCDSNRLGVYGTAGVAAGHTYVVSATHPRWTTVSVVVGTPPGLESRTVDLTFERPAPTASIAGAFRVNGVPAVGVIVCEGLGERRRVFTDTDGNFRIDALPAGPATLMATTRPFDRVRGVERGRVVLRRSIDVAGGREQRLDLDLRVELAPISGRVTRPSGAPAPGETVAAWGGEIRAAATTASDRTFRLEVPAWLPSWNVGVEDAGGARRTVPPGTAHVDFVVPDIGVLRVHVESHADARVPWILVRRAGTDDGFVAAEMVSLLRIEVDSAGAAALRLRHGLYDVAHFDPMRGWAPSVVAAVAVGERPADVRLQPRRGKTITLRAAGGTEPRAASMTLLDEALGGMKALVESDRTFRLEAESELVLRGVARPAPAAGRGDERRDHSGSDRRDRRRSRRLHHPLVDAPQMTRHR